MQRISVGILASGLLLIALALAFLFGAGSNGHLFVPILFTGLAFTTLLGSVGSMSPQGIYGGIQGFLWLLGLAFCFLVGFWPWILVVVSISVILGTLYAPIISASGADDLQPDAQNTISQDSVLRSHPRGFAHIGIPVRKLIEASGLDATYIYFGNLVYGPGKVFAEQFVNGLRNGTAHIIGKGENRLPLTHVTDAARALVHLASLAKTDVVGRTFLAVDGTDTTQRMLLEATADAMGVKRPGSADAWLAALVAGAISVETMTLDVRTDNSALLASGFEFRYPSYREGVPATLQALGYDEALVSAGASPDRHARTGR